jgi:hypothetical protein
MKINRKAFPNREAKESPSLIPKLQRKGDRMQNIPRKTKRQDPLRALFNIYKNFNRWDNPARERFFRLFDNSATRIADDPKVALLLGELRKAFEEVPQ